MSMCCYFDNVFFIWSFVKLRTSQNPHPDDSSQNPQTFQTFKHFNHSLFEKQMFENIRHIHHVSPYPYRPNTFYNLLSYSQYICCIAWSFSGLWRPQWGTYYLYLVISQVISLLYQEEFPGQGLIVAYIARCSSNSAN